MKRNFLIIFFVIAILAASFTSCTRKSTAETETSAVTESESTSESSSEGEEGYSKDELCRMSMVYYARHSGGMTLLKASGEKNDDGTYLIVLSLTGDDTGSENIKAKYVIDPATGKGTDELTGDSVDLNQ